MSDFVIPPPNPMADFERRAVLYQADGKALVRAAGFVPHGSQMALQNTGQFPQLTTKTTGGKKITGKGKKKGC